MKHGIALRSVLAAGVAILTVEAQAHDELASPDRMEADVRFLADDSLEGREAGTRGYDIAAGFVAGQFAAIGLKQSANGTYFQDVPMVEYAKPEGASNTLAVAGLGDFKSGVDYFVTGSPRFDERQIEGELVFVGYGFRAEGHEWDDLSGVDLNGKIAVVFRGAPSYLSSEERAYFSATQAERLSKAGAIGTIMLFTPNAAKQVPWEVIQGYLGHNRSMGWREDNGKVFSLSPNIRAGAVLGPAAAEALFADQKIGWQDIAAADGKETQTVRSFSLGKSARLTYAVESKDSSSPNVIAVLPGSDPSLAHEVIVVSAHLDHVGIRPTSEEGDDELHNGAMDNASGTATLLEVARLLVKDPPRRTVMFAAVTAEEKGLVGSDYLARNPVLAEGQKFVANVNLDMPIVTWAFTDVVAFGAENSTLDPVVREAAASMDLELSPDMQPEQSFFVRSDQYSFVKQGIPAVYLDLGWGNGGKEAQDEFLAKHYHQPSDEADLLRYEQLAKFADVNAEIIWGIGDMETAPKWKKGNFFGRTFGGPMEE